MLVRGSELGMSLMQLVIFANALQQVIPSNALSFSPFNQMSFNNHINTVMNVETLNPKGICFGYFITSFAYSFWDNEEIFENAIQRMGETKEFNELHVNLINTLEESQRTTGEKETAVVFNDDVVIITCVTVEKKTDVHHDVRYTDDLKKSVEAAVEMAINHFGDRIGLFLTNDEISHVVGITAKKHNDKIILQYDDPNYFVNVKFDNYSDAVSDITALLCLSYYNFYLSAWKKKQTGSIHLGRYHAECGDLHSSTATLCKWAKDKRDTFFAPKAHVTTAVTSSNPNAVQIDSQVALTK